MIVSPGATVEQVREHLASSIAGIRSAKTVTAQAKRKAIAQEYAAAVKRRDAIVAQRSKTTADEVAALRSRLLGPGVGRLASPAERVSAAASLRDAAARIDDIDNGDAIVRLIDRAAAHGDTHLLVAAAGAGLARRDAGILNAALAHLDADGTDPGWQRLWDLSNQRTRLADQAKQLLADGVEQPDELAGMSIYAIGQIAASDPVVAPGPTAA